MTLVFTLGYVHVLFAYESCAYVVMVEENLIGPCGLYVVGVLFTLLAQRSLLAKAVGFGKNVRSEIVQK